MIDAVSLFFRHHNLPRYRLQKIMGSRTGRGRTKWGLRLINCASFAIRQCEFALFYEERSCFSNSSPFVSQTGNGSGSLGH